MNTPETDTYVTPAIVDIASVHELTLAIKKHDNATPDGYEYNGILLTS